MDEDIEWQHIKYEEDLTLVANRVSGIRLVLIRYQDNGKTPDGQNHHACLWSWQRELEAIGFKPRTEYWTVDQYRNSSFFFEFFATIFRATTAVQLGANDGGDITSVESGERLGEKEWHRIAQWWNVLNRCIENGTEQEYPGQELISTAVAFLLYSQDSTLALTTEDKLCLVPETSKAGNSLHHIRACCPPLVLREVDSDTFQIVGPAYFRGSMGSEGWKKQEEQVITLK